MSPEVFLVFRRSRPFFLPWTRISSPRHAIRFL